MDEAPPTDDKKPSEKAKSSPLEYLGGDVGCVLVCVPIAVCIASYHIFVAGTLVGEPWAGTAAVAALAAMAFGIFLVALRTKG
jgi:hypothetical protein